MGYRLSRLYCIRVSDIQWASGRDQICQERKVGVCRLLPDLLIVYVLAMITF